MATAEGGRFDFDDGGSFVGEWCEGRAHGLGIATGPENQGEYSGEWTMGFESRGVYVWPSGNMYAGGWLKGKRHGEGTQIKGRWIYRGAFTAGFCGRYGIKESLTTCAKYEGSWHLNQFDGFGVETNSDGSMYAGAWSKGMRQGLGVRKSAPWALAAENSRAMRAAQSQSSLPSAHDSDRVGWRGPGSSGGSGGSGELPGGRNETFRSGFVLRATSYPPGQAPYPGRSQSASQHRSSSTDKKSSFKNFILRKLRKPKSTSDLSGYAQSGTGSAGGRFGLRAPRAGGSLRSNISGATGNSVFVEHQSRLDGAGLAGDSLDEPLGPNVTETYSGQWNEDRRSGYGVAERSDGLRYEGEWFNNKKDGFGVSLHPDGSREEGRYKENMLVQPLIKRNKLYLLRHSKLKDSVEDAVRKAREAAKEAQEKSSETAHQRAQTARSVANTADARSEEAKKLAEQARSIAMEFASDFVQMGILWERENPFAHMLTRSGAPTPTTGQLNLNGQTTKPDNTTNLFVNSLEVSGGNRRGSFRSSFKRSTSGTLNESNLDGPKAVQEIKPQQTQHLLTPNTARAPQFATVQSMEETQFETIGGPSAPVKAQTKKPPVLHTAQVVQSPGDEAQVATIDHSHPPPPISTPYQQQRVSQGRPMARAATAGFTGPPPLSAFDYMKTSQGGLAPPGERKRVRRRTLPSILTTPPTATPTPLQGSKTGTLSRPNAVSPLGNPPGEKGFAMAGLTSNLDDVHHSTEHLVETYIIEDGVKKRVQPTKASNTGAVMGSPAMGGQNFRRGHPISPDRRKKGSGEGRVGVGRIAPNAMETDYDLGELLPLPDAYRIESLANLKAGGLDASMPDVSKGVEAMLPAGGGAAPRLGIGGFLTRDEVCRLGQQRRHEILLDNERKRRGEIVIRLADIKDWLRANVFVVMIILMNIALAFVFINLVNNAGKFGPPVGQPSDVTPEEKQAAASAAAEAIKKAIRAANAAASSRARDKS